MTVRYFEIDKEEDLYSNDRFLAESDNKIIPRVGEVIFVGDTSYTVFDICYSTEYIDNKTVIISMIDITLLLKE